MKKRKSTQNLQLKKNVIVKLSDQQQLKGGLKDFTGDSCFEVCNTDVKNCTW